MKSLYKKKNFKCGILLTYFKRSLCLMLCLITVEVLAQNKVVTGTVKDATGLTLPGVSVLVKNSTNGVITGANGEFSIRVPNEQAVLEFKYLGFLSQQITVGNQSVIQVVLVESVNNLNEVVVVGYGEQKKATLTGAVSTIQTKEILQSPVANVTNSLAGRLTGVTTVQASGQPGANGSVINIRGAATYGNSSAIVIVDGIERPDFGQLDPNEIESISVLKDASSTAIFGIRGANGVILVTTRSGKVGKPVVSYSGNASIQTYTGIPKALSAYDNALLINEANRNDNLTETWTAEELQKFKDGSDPLGYPNVNWFDYVTKKYYPQTQHNLQVSGGTKVIKYFAMVGYLYEGGIFKEFDSPFGIKSTPDYNRTNLRSNLDITLSKNLTIGVILGGRLQKRYQPSGLQSNSFSYDNVEGMISRILQTPSFAYPIMLPDGRIAQNPSVGTNIWNPLAVLTRWGTRNDDFNAVESTFNINYNLGSLVKGLSFKANLGYDSYFNSTTRRNANWAAYVYDRRTGDVTLSPDRQRDEPLSGLLVSYDGRISSNLQGGLYYNRSFGKHTVTALALGTRQLVKSPGSSQTTAPPSASQGVVSRVTYNYDNRYFAEFNAAYNGSENFPIGLQYGFFPAVSAGWTITNEDFMKDISWLNLLKIRGSYGIVGNDNLSIDGTNQRFLFLENYGTASGGTSFNPAWSRPNNGVQFGNPNSITNNLVSFISSVGNPNITWEKGRKRNIGIDASFLKESIRLTFDLFDEKRTDILTARQSGLQTYGEIYPRLNIGEVYNKGYEIELDYQKRTGQFKYGLTTQLSFARNKVINRDEPQGRPEYQKQEGKRLGQFFGFVTDGFYDSQEEIDNSPKNLLGTSIPGDLKYIDVNQDGVITNDDQTAIGYSRTPEYTYSVTPRLAYKGFSLSVLFQGVANVSSNVILTEQNNGQQMYGIQLGRWTPETAATATWPALHSRGNPYVNYRLNDFILQDASYLKIRNAELSWNVPATWLKKAKISSLRLFLNGQNLHTWTKFRMYLDPENINLSNTSFSVQSLYPSSRIYNFGLNIQL